MAGSAVLGTSLVDGLVSTVDALRAALNPAMGTRPFRVFVVKRVWDGGRRGEGLAGIVAETELLPQPLVRDGLRRELRAAGIEEEGEITLSEISLTYTDAELTGLPLAANEECYYRLTDAHGQGIAPRYYVLARPPMPDREKDIGWVVVLRRAEVQETPEEALPVEEG